MNVTALQAAPRLMSCFLTTCPTRTAKRRTRKTHRSLRLAAFCMQFWVGAAAADSPAFGHWSQFLDPAAVPSYAVVSRLEQLAELREDPDAVRTLANCAAPTTANDFSIAHRGAPALFPEHTRESYLAAISQGAGIIECDVSFTNDGALVCRHSQCDLHTTTNILETPLAAKCRLPFSGATADAAATAKCCTNDLTLDEFRSLCGKHDNADRTAVTAKGYMQGASALDGQRYPGCGTLMTLDDSITLIEQHGRKHAPELKAADGPMPFTQAEYAQALIDQYRRREVPAERVFPQSFNPADLQYWLRAEPQFAAQAVLLDSRDAGIDPADPADPGPATDTPNFAQLHAMGLRYLAPPMWYLLRTEGNDIVPSRYAQGARDAGLQLIAWTLERSGGIAAVRATPQNAYYYQSTLGILRDDGDILRTLDVLAKDVGVAGVFSDWPATTTVYANCLGPQAN